MNTPIRTGVSLRPHHTFGLEVTAKWWLSLHSEAEARAFIMDNLHHRPPLLILGGGSNVLFTGDYPGLVLHNQIMGKEVVREDAQHVWLRVGAGENWHALVQYCLDHDWGGLENLSLIPGSVGAAPIQNIGAYGVELQAVFAELEALDLHTGELHHFDREACRFGYRDSLFKGPARGRYLITRVTLRLDKPPHTLHTHYGPVAAELAQRPEPPSIRAVSEVICAIRRSKLPDPAQTGNAGSFFKNPVIPAAHFARLVEQYPDLPSYPEPGGQVKVPAAWLIQTAGWKGLRRGNYGVHPQQALVLVNYGGARGQDIYDLSEEILQSVGQQFGIWLEREVNVVAPVTA